MTSLSHDEAYDEIMKMLHDGFNMSNFSRTKIFYEDVEDERLPNNEPFIKARVLFDEGRQKGFGGSDGKRLYTRHGSIRLLIYTLAGNGLSESLPLVKVILDSFEGMHSPGGVWFRSSNTVDTGRNGAFRVYDVAVFFTFDEIK